VWGNLKHLLKGRPVISRPLAATSVQIRNLASWFLNLSRLALRSGGLRSPWRQTQEYELLRLWAPPPSMKQSYLGSGMGCDFISTEKWFVIDRTEHTSTREKYFNTSKLQFEVYNSFECLNIISNQVTWELLFFYLLWIFFRYRAQNVMTGEWCSKQELALGWDLNLRPSKYKSAVLTDWNVQ